MKKYIQHLEPLSLRIAVLSICVSLLVLAGLLVWRWLRPPFLFSSLVIMPLVFIVFFLSTAYGLLRAYSWARRTAVIMLWIGALIFVPIALFNTDTASQLLEEGRQPPSAEEQLAFFLAIEFFAVWGLHMLGKYKAKFH
jgi:hypothetical protein